MLNSIPKIDNTYFCIAHKEENILTAVVSSHISKVDHYPLIFGFGEVTQPKDEKSLNTRDEHQITRSRGNRLNVDLGNTLRRLKGCDYLILIGINENQKSYFTFLNDYNVIEINSLDDVNTFLQPISNKKNISINSTQLYEGLVKGSIEKKAITIDEYTKEIKLKKRNVGGLIVVEDNNPFETIIATNYAISINADIEYVKPFNFHESEFLELIELWREEVKNKVEEKSFCELKALIYDRINHIDFSEYSFVTFFTIGAPYSLIIENIIPVTYVGLNLNPDFFIFNNIYFQDNFNIESAIVFSPKFFSVEETDFVTSKLQENYYHVSALIKEDATSNNLDYYVKELPFNILHLCSHGDQSEGSLIEEKYIDEFGNEHIFEYYYTISLAPDPNKKSPAGEPLIKVFKKIFPRKLNGYLFRTKEFKEQNYPSSIFPKMIEAVPIKENQISSKKVTLENSHEIACYRFSHLGLFTHLAAGHSPLIFNNTCWSAYDIKNHFIDVRARAYIGTLWALNNTVANKTAEMFYNCFFDKTILEALQESLVQSKGSKDANIYVFYGLHFTKFTKGESIKKSRENITRKLLLSIDSWQNNYNKATDSIIKESIQDLIKWNKGILMRNYFKELLNIIGKERLIEFFKKKYL